MSQMRAPMRCATCGYVHRCEDGPCVSAAVLEALIGKWIARAAQWSTLEIGPATSELLFCIDDLRAVMPAGRPK